MAVDKLRFRFHASGALLDFDAPDKIEKMQDHIAGLRDLGCNNRKYTAASIRAIAPLLEHQSLEVRRFACHAIGNVVNHQSEPDYAINLLLGVTQKPGEDTEVAAAARYQLDIVSHRNDLPQRLKTLANSSRAPS